MTPRELTEAFAVLADAPDGVQRLRELVLELAVRGRLVEQDPGEEPAVDAIKRLPKYRDALIRGGEILKPRHPAGVPVDQPPHEVPPSWAWVRLGDVGAIVGGGTPKSSEAAFWAEGSGIPWLTPADMRAQSSRYIKRGARDITEAGLARSSARLLPKGTVLFSSRAPIGHVGIAANPVATNQGFKSCVPYDSAFSEYLYTFLKKAGPEIDATATGTTFKEVSGKEVALVPVPVPPLAEQHRIVARVDELMGLLDRLEAARTRRDSVRQAARDAALAALRDAEDAEEAAAAWGRIRQHMDDLFTQPEDVGPLRQAVLQLAVRGRLVEQDPGDEPAAVLLKKVADAKTKMLANLGRHRESVEVNSDNGADWELPSNWAWAQVVDIAVVRTGATPSRNTARYWHGSVPWVSSGEVANCRICGTKETISAEALRDTSVTLYPAGTVLIAMIGQGKTRGQSAILDIEAATNQNSAALLLPADLMSSEYVWLWARSVYETSRSGGRGNAQPALNSRKIRAFWIPLPPLAEQHRIVAKVDALMALCDDLEARLTRARDLQAQFAAAAVHHLDAGPLAGADA